MYVAVVGAYGNPLRVHMKKHGRVRDFSAYLVEPSGSNDATLSLDYLHLTLCKRMLGRYNTSKQHL